MPVHQGPGYVRVVGRHLFPHVYHKVDKMKLFSASRRASRALAMVRLPSNYPYEMYSASAHVACAIAHNLCEGGNFTDSKSFIMALRPSELGTGLVDLLLADCIDQATPFPPP